MVAEAFIPNPCNYPQVNHLLGVRSDNRASELEWCSASQNKIHSIVSLKSDGNSVVVVDLYTGVFYNSIREAYDYATLECSFRGFYRRIFGTIKNKTRYVAA